jgi:hypothetical protein
MPLFSRSPLIPFTTSHEAPDGHALAGTFIQGDRP